MENTATQATPVFIERAPYEKGFADFFEKNLKERLQKAETDRLELLKEYDHRKTVGYPMYVPVILLAGILFLYADPQFGLFVGIGLGALLYQWIQGPVHKYRSNVKEGIVAELVTFFGELSFSESRKLDTQLLEDSGIVPGFTTYNGGDHLSGNYDGVDMEMCEVELKQKGNKDREYVVFKGEMFHIKLKKTFTGKTIVKKDSGFLGNAFGGIFTKLERVKLEDPKFEKEFEVYGTDQVEARYLLTTAFMERLLTLRDTFDKNGTIQCEFSNDHLFITIATNRDLFEAGPIEESCLDTEDIHIFLSQMESVFQVIEVLKLNKYTGL
ncbi:MAG: DUF3137 domain-containing protein [Candidatus Peregrinibacteria bacterium]|nr:DUF3137 domain-containing protein [Candidatus Peregrinibacteria bacterium]